MADYAIEFANAVAGICHVTLLCPANYFADQVPFVDPAVDLRLLDWPRHRSLRNPAFLFRLARTIHELRPDALHFLSEGVLWLNLLMLSIRRYPIVTTVHDVSYHLGDRASQRVPRRAVDFLIHRSDRIVVHGPALREESERRYPRLHGRIDILPHLPLTKYPKIAERRALRRTAGEAVTVLFFGRIYAYKGLHVLIESAATIFEEAPQTHFVIAGRGESIDQYTRSIAGSERFTVLNRYLSDEETAQVFVDADIVVLPYVEASQSGVLAIAQAFAKPVVVTDVGELASCVLDGITGIVVPPRDPAALARALITLAQDKTMRERMGEASRDANLRQFGADLFMEEAVRIYDRAGARIHHATPSATAVGA